MSLNKQLAAIAITTSVLTSSLSAMMQIGAGTADLGQDSGTNYSLAFGGDHSFDGGLYLGFVASYSFIEPESFDDTAFFSGEGRIGYTYKDFTGYGILGYGLFDLYSGMGYGAGINYQIIKNIGIGAEFKSFTLDDVLDYDSVGAHLRLSF